MEVFHSDAAAQSVHYFEEGTSGKKKGFQSLQLVYNKHVMLTEH